MAFAIPSQFKPCSINILAATAATAGTSRLSPRPTRTTFLVRSSKSQPSISDIERAIGISSDSSKSSSGINTSIIDLLESSPIGREGPTEKALREGAEKFTLHAEAHTASVHRFILELFVKILPLWLLVMAVASGLIKLPFSVPFIDDLIM